MKNSLSIEYGHFYITQGIGAEQFQGISLVKKLFGARMHEKTLTVLIDDRPLGASAIASEEIREKLSVKERRPDWLVCESGLTEAAATLVDEIPEELLKSGEIGVDLVLGKERIRLWRKGTERLYSCPLLSAAWHLCRLGEIGLPKTAAVLNGEAPFAGESALAVLPEKYRKVEEKAHTIISVTSYAEAISRIAYRYFQ